MLDIETKKHVIKTIKEFIESDKFLNKNGCNKCPFGDEGRKPYMSMCFYYCGLLFPKLKRYKYSVPFNRLLTNCQCPCVHFKGDKDLVIKRTYEAIKRIENEIKNEKN